MSVPAMTFDPAELLDAERMKNGPMVLYWGQDDYIPPNKPLDIERPVPQATWRHRLARAKPWNLDIRIMPSPDADLEALGREVSGALGVKWTGEPVEGDKAVWLPGLVWARNAPQALGSAKFLFDKLKGFQCSQVQVRVTRAQA